MNMNYIYIGFLVLAISSIVLVGNMFSVIDARPSCDIPENGGECFINFTLPSDRAYTEFALDLLVEEIPSENYGLYQDATNIIGTHTAVEEDDNDNGLSIEKIIMYQIPDGAYQIKVKSEADATVTSTRSYARSKSILNTYMISTDYPYDSIKVCTNARTSDCGGDSNLFLIKDYRDDGEDQYSLHNERYSLESLSNRNTDGVESETILLEMESYPTERQDVFLVSTQTSIEESGKAVISPPRVQYAVKNLVTPTNLGYGFDNKVLEFFSGETIGDVRTLDISEQLNENCNRENDVSECNIALRFTANSGGRIIVDNEDSTLKIAEVIIPPVEDPVVEDPVVEDPIDNQITGGVVADFVKSSTGITMIIVLVTLIIAGLIIFIPMGKR